MSTKNETQHQQEQIKGGSSVAPLKTDLYKTELCRKWIETGKCKYGKKCQYAHGHNELRNVVRHQKYKSKLCKNFHETGICPYGSRCNFIHNEEDVQESSSTEVSPMSPKEPFATPVVAESPLSQISSQETDGTSSSEEEDFEEEEEEKTIVLQKTQKEEKEKLIEESSEEEEFEELENQIFHLQDYFPKINLLPSAAQDDIERTLNFDEIFPSFERRLSAFSRRCPESNDEELTFNFESNPIF